MNITLKPNSKILLIEPPFYRFFNYERWHYPVTLTLVGTYLEELGHTVMIYDADRPTKDCKSLSRSEVLKNYPKYEKALENIDHPIWHEVYKTIKNYKPDVVGLTSITAKIDSANIVAKMVKNMFGTDIKVMLGGPHVQGMQISVPNYQFGSDYDYIVNHIPNLLNRKPKKSLLMDYNKYSPSDFSSILTSSGCPNVCTFCCHSYEKSFTYRNMDNLREELGEIKEKFPDNDTIYILDDCLFSNKKHFNEVIVLLNEFGFKFSAGSRIMSLTREKIDFFVKNGGSRVYVGVESGSQRILDRIEKRLRIEDIIKRTKWLNEVGIPWSAFFIVGFPFETLDDLKLTEELLYKIQPTFASINRFTPYPGTQIYNEYYSKANLRFKDLFQLNRNSCVKLTGEMEDYIERMFNMYDEYNMKNKDKFGKVK